MLRPKLTPQATGAGSLRAPCVDRPCSATDDRDATPGGDSKGRPMISDQELRLDRPDTGPDHAPKRRIASILRALFAVLVLGVVVVAAGLLAFEARYGDTVVPGVRVGDVDLSGLDRPAAAARLDAAFTALADGRVVVAMPNGQHSIAYAAVGRRLDLASMLDEAFAEIGHGGDVFERIGDTFRAFSSGMSIPPRVTFDSIALGMHVTQVAGLVERPPRDASVIPGDPGFKVRAAAAGQVLRTADATEAIARVVVDAELAPIATVDAPIATVLPRLDDAAAERTRAAAERMAGSELDLVLGDETWTIQASTVRSWIRFESAGAQDAPVVIPGEVQSAIARLTKKVGRPTKNASVRPAGWPDRGYRVVPRGPSPRC